jgi:hypothetical protein
LPANFPGHIWASVFCQQSFFRVRAGVIKMTAKEGFMGHYTIRTNDDEDQAIKKAQEATGHGISQQSLYDGYP